MYLIKLQEASGLLEKALIAIFHPPTQECPTVPLPPEGIAWISNLPATFEPEAFPREYAYGQLRMKIASPFWKAWRLGSSVNVVTEVGEIVPTQLTIAVSAWTPCGLLTVTGFELLRSSTVQP